MQELGKKFNGWWYKLQSWFYKLLGFHMTVKLPRDPKYPTLLDKRKIKKVMLIYPLPPHSPYFMCEIDGVWRHLVFSDDLKKWFESSGIAISIIHHEFEKDFLEFYKLNPTTPNAVVIPDDFSFNALNSTDGLKLGG